MHGKIQPLDVDHRVHGVAADLPGRGEAPLGKKTAESFPEGNPREKRQDCLHVPPGQLDAVGVLRGQRSFFKELHRPGDDRPATDRVHPVTVAQFVRLDHPGEIPVHDHRPEGGASLILRTRAFLRLIRTVRNPDHPLAGHRAMGTGVGAGEIGLGERRTAQRAGEREILADGPVFNRDIPVDHADVHIRIGSHRMERTGHCRLLDLQNRGLVNLPEACLVCFFRFPASPDADRLESFCPHDRPETRPADEMTLVVSDGGETHEVFPGRPDGEDLHPRFTRLEQVGGFVNILPPEIRSVAEPGLPLDDDENHRPNRPAGNDDPVVARLLEFRTERPPAGRLSPDPCERRLGADRKTGGPRKTAPHHRPGHDHERALRGEGIGIKRIAIQK